MRRSFLLVCISNAPSFPIVEMQDRVTCGNPIINCLTSLCPTQTHASQHMYPNTSIQTKCIQPNDLRSPSQKIKTSTIQASTSSLSSADAQPRIKQGSWQVNVITRGPTFEYRCIESRHRHTRILDIDNSSLLGCNL
jgi:hypothetical protein